jgi:uncharacterized protein YoxC
MSAELEQALQQALQIIDEGAAIIQEMTAQLQQKSQHSEGLNKKAEQLAGKVGVSYEEAENMLKEAQENGGADAMLKIADTLSRKVSFGRVAGEEMTKTASNADNKFHERQALIMEELGLA